MYEQRHFHPSKVFHEPLENHFFYSKPYISCDMEAGFQSPKEGEGKSNNCLFVCCCLLLLFVVVCCCLLLFVGGCVGGWLR